MIDVDAMNPKTSKPGYYEMKMNAKGIEKKLLQYTSYRYMQLFFQLQKEKNQSHSIMIALE